MSFKKAVIAAKKMQQIFSATLPAGDGSEFEASFKVLTGEEGVWTLRIDPLELCPLGHGCGRGSDPGHGINP